MLIKEIGRAKALILRPLGLEPAPNTDAGANGEYGLLRWLCSLPEAAAYNSVIDVGANVGAWTQEAIRHLGGIGLSTFYCVEPIPKYSSQIKERFADESRVKVVEKALSAEGGQTLPIFEVAGGGRMYRTYRGQSVFDQTHSHSSSPAGKTGKATIEHMAEISTGDAVFADSAVKPYLIKIDCDGHDCHVLQGFAQVVADRRPVIQFEYCDFWIAAGSRLTDACQLLYRSGYKTFKMFPNGLRRFQCNLMFETFGYQNVVAVPGEFPSFAAHSIAFER